MRDRGPYNQNSQIVNYQNMDSYTSFLLKNDWADFDNKYQNSS